MRESALSDIKQLKKTPHTMNICHNIPVLYGVASRQSQLMSTPGGCLLLL